MIKVNQTTVFRREFDDSSLLFDPVTGKAFYLNNVATFIWQQLCSERSLDDIKLKIQYKFSNIPPNIDSDLDDFLESLIENGFLGTVL